MIIQLPLENWTDLLPFVPRRQLVEIVKQLNDRQFAKILQFFLTEVGHITLCKLRIVAPWQYDSNGGGPIVEVRRFWPEWASSSDLKTNLPEGPMPTNVKDFKLINLSYFDVSVANFLRHYQQEQQPGNSLSLLDNVNLCIYSLISPHDDNTYIRILTQLMPMIGNINSIYIYGFHHMECGCDKLEPKPSNAASQLLTTMFTNAKILEIRGDIEMCMFAWCDHWLYAPRNDGKPRTLRLYGNCSFSIPNTKNLIERIKKDFLKATRPVSFFVHLRAFHDEDIYFMMENVEWQDICVDNGQTNERLIVKAIGPPPTAAYIYRLLISRYPVAANQERIEANEQEIVKWDFDKQNRRIILDHNLKINGDSL